MTTLGTIMMILLIIGVLVYCYGLILTNNINTKIVWVEIGTPIFILYFIVCITIYSISEGQNLSKPIDGVPISDQIYIVPTCVY